MPQVRTYDFDVKGVGEIFFFFFFIIAKVRVRTCAFKTITPKIFIFPKLTPQVRTSDFDVEGIGETFLFFFMTTKLTGPDLCH